MCMGLGMVAASTYLFLTTEKEVPEETQLSKLVTAGITFAYTCGIRYCILGNRWPDFRRKNLVSPEEAEKFFQKAACGDPILSQEIECYHGSKIVTFSAKISKMFLSTYDYSPQFKI